MTMYYHLKVGLSVLVLSMSGSLLQAEQSQVEYPKNYRNWTHIKSMLIEKGHVLADPFQGIHHVYANDKGLSGLRSGHYEDGAVLVFDLLEYQQGNRTIVEQERKLLGVMQKDRTAFSETGGWGFEGFANNSQTERLTSDGGNACFGCHQPQQNQDYVFSRYRQ